MGCVWHAMRGLVWFLLVVVERRRESTWNLDPEDVGMAHGIKHDMDRGVPQHVIVDI